MRRTHRPILRAASWLALLALGLSLVLAACTSATSPGTGTPPPSSGSSITVQGAVFDLNGFPLPHVDVLLGGKLASTAADGSFTVTGVTPPYDLAVSVNATATRARQSWVLVYQGLTQATPSVFAPVDVSGTVGNAYSSDNVTGTLGRPLDQTSNEAGLLIAGAPRFAMGDLSVDASTTTGGTFGPLAVTWGGPTTLSSTLFALTWDPDTATNLPGSYTGYAAVPVTLADGVDATGVSLPLSASGLTTDVLNGTVTAPVGYTLVNASGCSSSGSCLQVGESLMVRLHKGQAGAAIDLGPYVTSAKVPVAADGSIDYAIVARAEPSGATTDGVLTAAIATAPNLGQTASNTLNLPTPPGPLTPVNHATGVTTGTQFSWQTLNDSVYGVLLEPQSFTSNIPFFLIMTAASHTALPDLSKLGIQLQPAAGYTYDLLSFGPFATTDALLAQPLWFLELDTVLSRYFDSSSLGSGFLTTAYPVPDLRVTEAPGFVFTSK